MEHKLGLKMAEEEPYLISSSKKIKQSISVPFVWEMIPGTPKKDWKPTPPPTKPMEPPVKLIEWHERPGKPFPYHSQPPPSSPLAPPQAESNPLQARGKLIASVPFEWEEKPGKPLPSCLQPLPPSSSIAPPQAERKRLQAHDKLIASVPFEWEEKPGKPLPSCLQQIPASSPAVLPKAEMSGFALPGKLIASVPFEWEEKPGTPLPCFLQPPLPPLPLALPPAECNTFPSWPGNSEGNDDNWIGMNDQDGDESEMLESDTETCGYETDDGSFSSVPSFSANSIAPIMSIPYAIPSQQSLSKDLNSGQLQSPGSPASETESTGTTSLVGASFLEWLFPLLAPRSSFLDKVGYSETVSQIEPKKQITDLHQEKHYTATIRRPPTLGELIMMSQRRSYQRKAIQMQKQNLSKEIMKRNAVGRNIFDTSNILGRFDMKWKRQLQLKLM